VDYLEGEGLVHRVADPEDRRSQLVTLTSAGVVRRDQARAALEHAIKQRFSILSQAEIQQLLELNQRLRTVLLAEIEQRSNKEL
jgi:DNA-binding MarR family transcriptional regulator